VSLWQQPPPRESSSACRGEPVASAFLCGRFVLFSFQGTFLKRLYQYITLKYLMSIVFSKSDVI
ncbi:hypothetical protein ABEV38_18250, partial [Parageobacillus thermoglucosidasius]|uniref:hypothetical protein n=1 Tax=Parageobacillus thermoglucosidasius TaxID=1426 RepID=UPI003D283C41